MNNKSFLGFVNKDSSSRFKYGTARRSKALQVSCAFYLFIRGCLLRLLLPCAPQ